MLFYKFIIGFLAGLKCLLTYLYYLPGIRPTASKDLADRFASSSHNGDLWHWLFGSGIVSFMTVTVSSASGAGFDNFSLELLHWLMGKGFVSLMTVTVSSASGAGFDNFSLELLHWLMGKGFVSLMTVTVSSASGAGFDNFSLELLHWLMGKGFVSLMTVTVSSASGAGFENLWSRFDIDTRLTGFGVEQLFTFVTYLDNALDVVVGDVDAGIEAIILDSDSMVRGEIADVDGEAPVEVGEAVLDVGMISVGAFGCWLLAFFKFPIAAIWQEEIDCI